MVTQIETQLWLPVITDADYTFHRIEKVGVYPLSDGSMSLVLTGVPPGYRPSHTLRYYTLMMECTKAPAMYENSMRCSAMHFPTCGKCCSRWWHISVVYCPIFKQISVLRMAFHKLSFDI